PEDLREPVERLVDTGQRLNALRTEEELQDFLIEEVAELVGAQRVLLVLEKPEGRLLAASLVPRDESAAAMLEAVSPQMDEARALRLATLRHDPEAAETIDQRSVVIAPM